MYRKAWEIVGYTADADVWCVSCAESAYGPDSYGREDVEGNLVHAIFVSDLGEMGTNTHCNMCGEGVSA